MNKQASNCSNGKRNEERPLIRLAPERPVGPSDPCTASGWSWTEGFGRLASHTVQGLRDRMDGDFGRSFHALVEGTWERCDSQ
jgi:hypothetical protein